MPDPDLRLPKRVADPTHTVTLRIGYQRSLGGLFTRFRKRISPYLNDTVYRAGISNEVSGELDLAAESTIYAEAPNRINKHVNLSYKAGKRQASRNPRIKRSTLTIPYSLNYLDQQVIADLQTRNFSLVKGASETMKTNMLRVMSEGIQQNKGTLTIARNMTKEISSIGKKRAKLIAQTEMAHSYNNAISKSYQQAGIRKWQWLTTMSDRTCEICAGKHGEVFNWGAMQPPEHPLCLCSIYPVVDREFKR